MTQTENCNTQACTEECVGGASYIGPNTDPSKQDAGDYSGCAAYNHSASTKEKCNTSYQMDAQGNYTQCELDTSDNTCKPKATNCKPKLNSNNKPTCKLATWIPHSKAVLIVIVLDSTLPQAKNNIKLVNGKVLHVVWKGIAL